MTLNFMLQGYLFLAERTNEVTFYCKIWRLSGGNFVLPSFEVKQENKQQTLKMTRIQIPKFPDQWFWHNIKI